MNVCILEKRSFADVTKILWCYHPELTGWALNPIPNILVERGENTEKKAGSCGDRGRDWSDAARPLECQGATRNWKRQGEIPVGKTFSVDFSLCLHVVLPLYLCPNFSSSFKDIRDLPGGPVTKASRF